MTEKKSDLTAEALLKEWDSAVISLKEINNRLNRRGEELTFFSNRSWISYLPNAPKIHKRRWSGFYVIGDIFNGLYYGYPPCCIINFSFAKNGDVIKKNLEREKKYPKFENEKGVGYFQCDRCYRKRILTL